MVYADLIIMATDFYLDSSMFNIERQLDLCSNNILNKKIYLLLLHPEVAKFPENTRRWFENRKIDLHIHVDGGVVDNLPIEIMYNNPVRHFIVVSLSQLRTQ
jgi:hypothetical protein